MQELLVLEKNMGRVSSPPAWHLVLFALALALVASNTAWFTLRAANPVLISDTWSFVSSVVMPHAEGRLEVGDLFAKRSAMDHSQPLRRLLLIANYEWFNLDLAVEAYLGVLFAFATLALLWMVYRKSLPVRGRPGGAELLLFLALAASYLSLNTTVVFAWPLLTTSFTNHPFIVLTAWLAWRGFEAPNPRSLALLFVSGFWLSLIADDTGLLFSIALALASALHGFRTKAWRNAMAVAGTVLLSHAIYAVLYPIIASPAAGGGGGLGQVARLGELLASLGTGAWRLLEAPLAGAVAHRGELQRWAGGATWPVVATAVTLAVGHAWFWIMAVRGRTSVASFVSTTLMLLFYGVVAGLLVARVTGHGPEYLWQPRYSIFYRWSAVAIFLMALGQLAGVAPAPRKLSWALMGPCVFAVLMVVVQVPLSLRAWDRIPYMERHQQRQAAQIIAVASAGDQVTVNCMRSIVVCKFPEDARKELMWFLESQQLNVFDPEIRRRHSLDRR